jgi:hypothetical protein
MPEISEVEYAELTRLKGIAEKINANPKAREQFMRAAAEAMPDQVGPEIRIRQEFDERFAGLQKTINEFVEGQTTKQTEREKAEQQREFEKRWLEGRSYAKNAGVNDDGLKDLESFMEREGIASHKHALAAWEKERPTPPAPVTGNYGFDFFKPTPETGGDDALKALLEGRDDEFLALALPGAIAAGRGA